MQHFVKDDGLNTFRIPVGWQFLLNNNLGGTLDSNAWATYDKQIQGCLNAGAALCIVDIHNYARWNGAIVGQGGPTNAQFTSLWSQIAAKYKGNSKIAFGLMNEPVSETRTSIPEMKPKKRKHTDKNPPARPKHQHLGHNRPRSRHRNPQSRRNQQQDPATRHRLHLGGRFHLQRIRRRSDKSDQLGRHHDKLDLRRAQVPRLGQLGHAHDVHDQQRRSLHVAG
jgi:hypothetical protein